MLPTAGQLAQAVGEDHGDTARGRRVSHRVRLRWAVQGDKDHAPFRDGVPCCWWRGTYDQLVRIPTVGGIASARAGGRAAA